MSPPDRYDLYELAAQSPVEQAAFLCAVHRASRPGSPEPTTLGEDFSAAGAVSRAWVSSSPRRRAVCVDTDPEPLARLALRTPEPHRARITAHQQDVMETAVPVDVLAALNFSVCELRTRRSLVSYLRLARSRVAQGPSGGPGVFVCDLYGGADAYALGESETELRSGVRYTWEQRTADPATGLVENAMHFFPPDSAPLRDAFVYRWRLWSLPEMRDAALEAGFIAVDFYDRLGDGVDTDGTVYAAPLGPEDELDENYVVYVAARL